MLLSDIGLRANDSLVNPAKAGNGATKPQKWLALMKRSPYFLSLCALFLVVWPIQGQTPTTAPDFTNRGLARQSKGDLNGAIADHTKAIEIDPRDADAYSSLAWLLATSSNALVRNGTKAVEYALKAAELTDWKDPLKLETLAAAYAEKGSFEEAIKWQEKALTFPEYEKEHGLKARERLQFYRDRKSYHEPSPK